MASKTTNKSEHTTFNCELDTNELKPNDRSVCKLLNDKMSCIAMSTAIRLANEMIFKGSDKVKQIYLNYNVENSEVDLIDKEFTHHILTLSTDPSPMNEKDQKEFLETDVACFAPYVEKDLIFLNPRLVEFCSDLNEKSPGFHRVVFFLAMTILHETSHWKMWAFKNNRGEHNCDFPGQNKEAGDHFEFELNNGVLELHYKDYPRLILSIIDKDKKRDDIDSPQVTDFYLKRHKKRQMERQQTPITTQSTPHKDTAHQAQTPTTSTQSERRIIRHKSVNLQVVLDRSYKVDIILQNDSDEEVVVPTDFNVYNFDIKLTYLFTGKLAPKTRSCKRNYLVPMGSSLSRLGPKETHTYSSNLMDIISPFYNIKNAAFYQLEIMVNIGPSQAFPYPQDVTSSPSTKLVYLNAKDFADKETITTNYPDEIIGTVPSPSQGFVYRIEKLDVSF